MSMALVRTGCTCRDGLRHLCPAALSGWHDVLSSCRYKQELAWQIGSSDSQIQGLGMTRAALPSTLIPHHRFRWCSPVSAGEPSPALGPALMSKSAAHPPASQSSAADIASVNTPLWASAVSKVCEQGLP